ncbi:phage/plasmid primase, P4 family [Streptomyces sp. NPDC059918]|uniref:DNA primase family protein n=1 Tax=unclassified Streptomyces TaxID=2593676 RepID=UPI00364F99C4
MTESPTSFDPVAVALRILDTPPTEPETSAARARPVPSGPVPAGPAAARPYPAGAARGPLFPDSLTDRGNAKLFVTLYGRDYRHVPGLGWYRWSGYRWELDEDDTVVWTAGEMAEQLAEHDPSGVFTTSGLRQHRRRALSTAGMKAMLMQARSAPGMVLSAAQLDADPYALCTPGGVVDLRTGEVVAPDPTRHYHSRATTVAPASVPAPRWEAFLRDTFGDGAEGAEMVDFLQLLLGYSITGDVGAQVMPFLHGLGKNGKSVLLEALMKLLGDYADAAPPGFLMAKPFEGHPTDLAELHGRRVIVCSELKPGDRFDEARVKLLTGGDRIKARRMRQDFFSINPTHKLWLLGNHRPEVGTGGFAFWRRMRLIPFERVVPDHRKVDNLADSLVRDEGPAILSWLIDGAGRYLAGERDLTGPDRVRIATTAYAETEDHMGRFIAEACRLDSGLRAEQATLYQAYRQWCLDEGANPVTSRAFAARVRETLGMSSPKQMQTSNQRKFYPGIGLLTCHVGEETP